MSLKWVDSLDVALELLEAHPDVEPQNVRFTDLYEWILALDAFDDDPQRCNEQILEAILQCWLDEK
ncbi:Fe-S cluster assembly protein IscX [Shewanella sp. YIC-542]|uniref:Fe-S cluster assembly protein IscX n=1 Tax=Shewanella mytili TaxID=3377111 RepID=UPI00398F8738